jgi:transcriptional regulator with XRE-family HTH domain
MNYYNPKLGKRIKFARESQGLTQTQLGNKIGNFNGQFIHAIETDNKAERVLSRIMLTRICNALGIDHGIDFDTYVDQTETPTDYSKTTRLFSWKLAAQLDPVWVLSSPVNASTTPIETNTYCRAICGNQK